MIYARPNTHGDQQTCQQTAKHQPAFFHRYLHGLLIDRAAYFKSANIDSLVSLGCASRISSTVSPAASFSRINSTVIRVPAITGLPIIISGSDWIRFISIASRLYSTTHWPITLELIRRERAAF